MQQSLKKIFYREVVKIFGKFGECSVPNPSEFEQRLEKHRNLPDTCFYVLDLRQFKAIHVHGTERIFGVTPSDFAQATLGKFIHPSYLNIYIAKALAVYRGMEKFNYSIHPDVPYYYNIFLPLRLKDKRFYRTRQMSIPFCLDKNGKMVLQLNIIRTGFQEYSALPLNSYFTASTQEPLNGQTKQMKLDQIQILHDDIFVNFPELAPKNKHTWGFTTRELELLQIIASHPEMGFVEAANKLSISVHRARGIWLKSGIKEKMNDLFYPRVFNSIHEVANFFKQMNVLR